MSLAAAFSWDLWDAVVPVAAFAFIVGAAVCGASPRRTTWDKGVEALVVGAETALLATCGAILARLFLYGVMSALPHTEPMRAIVALAFFFPYGVAASIALAAHSAALVDPNALLWLATIVGALAGAFDGYFQIHDWKGGGWLGFPLDVTWGLSGTLDACLIHLINFSWGAHSAEFRHGAHRYARGFGLRSGYAFTQGSAMSNLSDAFGTNLYYHERTHVWQNRIFGPLYTSFYVFWMLALLIPALIVGAVAGAGAAGAQVWCYFNNPWETYAYHVQRQDRAPLQNSDAEKGLLWSGPVVATIAMLIFAGYATLSYLALAAAASAPPSG